MRYEYDKRPSYEAQLICFQICVSASKQYVHYISVLEDILIWQCAADVGHSRISNVIGFGIVIDRYRIEKKL